MVHRAHPAQHLLDRGVEQCGVLLQALPLGRVLDERAHAARDQVASGLVAGDREQQEEGVEVHLGELLAVDFAHHERAHQVVAGILLALLGQLVRIEPHLHGRLLADLRGVAEFRVVEADQPVAPLEDLVAVLERHADQLGDDDERQFGRDVAHEVAVAERGHAVEDLSGRLPDPGLQARRHAGREPLAHELAVLRVLRRIHVQHDGARVVEILLGEIAHHGAAAPGRIGLGILGDRDQVLVLRDRVEALAVRQVLPEHRGLVAQQAAALPPGIADSSDVPDNLGQHESSALEDGIFIDTIFEEN